MPYHEVGKALSPGERRASGVLIPDSECSALLYPLSAWAAVRHPHVGDQGFSSSQ